MRRTFGSASAAVGQGRKSAWVLLAALCWATASHGASATEPTRDLASPTPDRDVLALFRYAFPDGTPPAALPQAAGRPTYLAQAQPSAEERQLIERARDTGTAEAYEAYLAAYPSGVFAEFARVELEAIRAAAAGAASPPSAGTAGSGDTAAEAPEAMAIVPKLDIANAAAITFASPLGIAQPELQGKSIGELIKGQPLFPPIEGLPNEVWAGKHCTDCHQWEKDNLCTQAETFSGPTGERSLSKPHPYGTAFKQILKDWADAGCQ